MAQTVYGQRPQRSDREAKLRLRFRRDKLATVLPTDRDLGQFRGRGIFHCLILGFATEYSTSVKKFTATYVSPIARMQPCTR
jgi:hypothetical protein